MRRLLFTLSLVFLLLAVIHPAAAQEITAQPPVVHAALFWMPGCANCEAVMTDTLPQLQTKYGEQLEITLVEVNTTEDVERLYQVGAAFDLAREQVGVPLLVIDDRVLVGVEQIPAELPGLVDSYLAAGGVTAPDLNSLAASGKVALEEKAIEESSPQFSGMTLAWVVLIALVAALVFTGVVLARALQGKAPVKVPAWADLAIPLLSVIGIGVALYLTYVETTKTQAICGPVGDCNAVQSSPYAMLFGWLPVGVVGMLGYLAILAAWIWKRASKKGLGEYMPAALLGMALFGTLFSIYLTYLEIFVIHAVCIWCIASAVVILLIMLASLPSAASWLVATEESEA